MIQGNINDISQEIESRHVLDIPEHLRGKSGFRKRQLEERAGSRRMTNNNDEIVEIIDVSNQTREKFGGQGVPRTGVRVDVNTNVQANINESFVNESQKSEGNNQEAN